ncbi:hypothetical protein DITRI_Ditri11bG0024100 [Diplodiscus trichospermus]
MGHVVILAMCSYQAVQSPPVKFSASLFGLEISSKENVQVNMVEGDSLLAITVVNLRNQSFSEWFGIIMDIVMYAEMCGIQCFTYVKREANELAHKVAKSHQTQNMMTIWHGALPPNICN